MVNFSIQYPLIIIMVLGFAAIIIFMLSKFLHISNLIMASLSTLTFLLMLLLIIFQNYLQKSSIFIKLATFLDNIEIYSSGYFNSEDSGAILISIIALALATLVSLYSAEYLNQDKRQRYFYPLLLLMISGFIGMLFTSNLMVLYLFSELMSICTYSLVAFRRQTDTAIEAGFKYLMMGSVASVVILLGIAFLFFSNGTININEIEISNGWISQVGAILIFSGFCLKSAMVPLHTWLPDAHGRAPSSISAILSGITIQGVFYTSVRLLLSLGFDHYLLGTILLILSLLNILVGNVMGLVQDHTKRLLGYSTISQMGYIALCMAIGLRNNLPAAIQTGFFIIIVHAAAKSLAFLSKGVLHYYIGATKIKDLERSSELPNFISLAFGLGIISLAAIPPFAGFTGKWMVLTNLIASDDKLSILCILVFLGGSIIALGYYFPLLINIFSQIFSHKKKAERKIKRISPWMGLPIAVLVIAIFYISMAPQFFLKRTEEASYFLLGMMR